MSRLNKSIGWCDMTLNPIKGKCQGGCWYCWTEGFRQRGFLPSEIKLKTVVFNNLPKKPKKIFLCSTHDLFGSWIPKRWRDAIFFDIKECYPQHTFQILTKFPQNFDRPMPANVWLGVTIDTFSQKSIERSWHLYDYKHDGVKFVCFEPLLEKPVLKMVYALDWVIVGRLTRFGHKYDPKREWIEEIVKEYGQGCKIPIFLKENLKEIWGEPLIQEFPKEKR